MLDKEDPREPSFREAMNDNEKDLWIQAMFKEIQVNLDKGTLRFCRPDEALNHLVDTKWVLHMIPGQAFFQRNRPEG
jgi:hypothetical protein